MVERKKIYEWILFILGIYIMLDGIISIVVYVEQPFLFDNLFRVIRVTVGMLIVILIYKT